MQAVAADLGWYFKLKVWVDSTVVRAVANRTLSAICDTWKVRCLWVQEALRDGRFKLSTVAVLQNLADFATKGLGEVDFPRLVEMVGGRLVARSAKQRWDDMISFFFCCGRNAAEACWQRDTHPLIL